MRSFDFAPSGEILPDEQTNTGNVAPQLFAANPTNPEEYAVVNPTGQLYFGAGGNNEPILTEPFTEYTYQVQNRAENNAVVTEITYSPTGKLAFVIAGNSINIDGVWIVQTIQGFRLPVQVLRDCPREGHPGCATVLGEGRTANYWVTERVKWNPADEQQLLAELYLPEEGRGGFVILTTELPDVERLPPVFRYESATWAADGAQIIASGASPTGQQVITAIDPNTGAEQLLLNASSIGLYTQSATRLSDGRVVAFASNAPNGIVRLMDVNGNALSGGVGVTPPERITWNAARTTALVRTTDGRAFLVNAGW